MPGCEEEATRLLELEAAAADIAEVLVDAKAQLLIDVHEERWYVENAAGRVELQWDTLTVVGLDDPAPQSA